MKFNLAQRLLVPVVAGIILYGAAAPHVTAQGHAWFRHRALPNAVAAGDVMPTSAVLWARSDRGKVLFLLRRRTGFWGPRWFSVAVPATPEIPAKVQFTGLTPDTSYSYYAFSRGRFSSGTFRTPALPGSHVGLRFGVSGDQRGDLAPFPAVTNAVRRGLDLFVFLGDTIYADIPSPDLLIPQATTLDEFRIKHMEVYAKRFGLNSLAQLRAAMPILTTIDDHEGHQARKQGVMDNF